MVESPYTELRLFNLLSHMKWAHLPVRGGFYDQDPALMDKFAIIFAEIDKHQAEEDEKRKAEADEQRARANRKARRGGRHR